MLIITVTNKETKTSVEIPASSFADYCAERNWDHSCAKAVLAMGDKIHYEKHFLVLSEKPEPKTKSKSKSKDE